MAPLTDAQRIELVRNIDAEQLSTVIPPYWTEYLAEKIQHIRTLQAQAGENGASFGLVTDFHIGDNCMHSPALLNKILTECDIPYFFNAGDFVSGMGIIDPADLILEITQTHNLFSRIADRMLTALGNHDMAYSTFPPPDYYAEFLTRAEVDRYIFEPQMAYPGRVFHGDDFYADDSKTRMRYIALNTHYTPSDALKPDGHAVYNKFRLVGFLDSQVKWFANVALQVPDPSWSVVLCTHESIDSDPGTTFYNRELILGVIDAFRKHTAYTGSTHYDNILGYDASIEADFTGKGGDFVAWVGGHFHRDDVRICDGILTLCSINDCVHNAAQSPYAHIAETTSEQSFDIFTVDKNTHRLYATKIGCGEDRVFDYEVFPL